MHGKTTLEIIHVVEVASLGICRVETEVKRKAIVVSPRVGAEFV
jgi:hypothetical protein